MKYVKVVDAIRPEDFIETTVVLDDGSVEENYFEIEDSLGLKALIVQGVSGFQSRAPDLNTFFIVYLNTIVGTNGLEKKTYTAEETLSIRKFTLLTDEFTYEDFLKLNGNELIPMFVIRQETELSVITTESQPPSEGETVVSFAIDKGKIEA